MIAQTTIVIVAGASAFPDGQQPAIVFDIDWTYVLTFLVGTFLPLVVAIVSTKVTSAKAKGILLALLSLVTSIASGILDALLTASPYDLGQNILLFGGTFVWAVASYFGIWRAEGKGGQPSIATKLTEGSLRRDRRAR
jgi:predicted membrane-bound spermidine synthase